MTARHLHRPSLWTAVRAMHEWPLVAFTACAIAAAGTVVASAVLRVSASPARMLVPAASLALAAGLVASLAHLGRPGRAMLALRRTGRNALSTEVALASLVVALGVAPAALPPALHLACLRAAGTAAAALLASLGLVYFLPARAPWRSPLVATPLLSGVAAGGVILCALDAGSRIRAATLILLALDLAVFAIGWAVATTRARRCRPVYPAIVAHRVPVLALRLALVTMVPVIAIGAGLPLVALPAVLAGLVVDRFAFYAFAAAGSTEAEVDSVERAIAQN